MEGEEDGEDDDEEDVDEEEADDNEDGDTCLRLRSMSLASIIMWISNYDKSLHTFFMIISRSGEYIFTKCISLHTVHKGCNPFRPTNHLY